ncbi:MAG: MFS transporter [SAR202 cluster bacterium]|jgi:MFS family permease|nr:MFS transporter [SAR202 cluster bacterium]
MVLLFASATHVWSDLFYALMIALLPLMQTDPDLLLSYTDVGLVRTVYSGASAALQIPAGYLAESVGEFWLLLGGNMWVAAGLVGMALAPGFMLILAITLVSGLGGGTQHPLATSMVSRSYDDGRSTAVGTVNFAGDLGKMAAPAVALLVAIRYGWRATMRIVGLGGLAFMAITMLLRRTIDRGRPSASLKTFREVGLEKTNTRGFLTLGGIGFLDSATRSAALTFLPFIMKEKGMNDQQTLIMLLFLLAGGAVGKYVTGWLGDRYGAIRLIWGTKGLTATLLVVASTTPTLAMAPLMFVLGIGLNGTSSVLYSTVSSFVPTRTQPRAYGYYYTITETGGTIAPIIYGRVADLLNIRLAITIMSGVTAMILPTSLALRKPLEQRLGKKD